MDDIEKECGELLKEIEREVETLLDNSITNASEVAQQTDKLENIAYNSEEVSHQQNISNWHLNYIASTFGKIYKNINEYPFKKTTSKILKQLQLKSNVIRHDIKTTQNFETVPEKCTLDRISNKLVKVKNIADETNNELSKHNAILDYTHNIVDNATDKMEINTRKIHKILK